MVLVACGNRPQQPAAHPDWSYNSVVYEMNVRQYTPEGTLAAAARHLPRLQKLGVDVVWLMPVYPIGIKERKGTLGSYYAISDYEAVNPEFGTLEDFDRFLTQTWRRDSFQFLNRVYFVNRIILQGNLNCTLRTIFYKLIIKNVAFLKKNLSDFFFQI